MCEEFLKYLCDGFIFCLILGIVEIFRYGYNEFDHHQLVYQHNHHQSSCRGLLFTEDGNSLFSVSSDHSIICVDGQGRIKQHIINAHNESINKITKVFNMPNSYITGDDIGTVKLWDTRQQDPAITWYKIHEDFISDILSIENTSEFLTTSG